MENIAVFCGSAPGNKKEYFEVAKEFGQILAKNKKRIIFGGGKVGLMGALADGALENNGEVIGVIPDFLVHKEIVHEGVTDIIVVKTMTERKEKIMEMSDAYVAMPGGFGTLDELFEVLTMAQLGRFSSPVALLNINNYFDGLIKFLETMVETDFLKSKYFEMIINTNNPHNILKSLYEFKPPELEKWFR